MQVFGRFSAVAALLVGLAGTAWAQAPAAPEADAGDDVLAVRCAGPDGTRVTLDGSGSTPPDASFQWSAPGVTFNDAASVTPTGLFPLGVTTVELRVSTADGASDTDTVAVEVIDDTPPTIGVRPNPSMLWPPNHKLHDVQVRIRVSDDCSRNVAVALQSVTSSEADNGRGDGNTADDIQDVQLGTDDRLVRLRAERSGKGDGRVYALRYRATDSSGNHSFAVARVIVPHDMSQRRDDDADDDHRRPRFHDVPDPGVCPLPGSAVEMWADVLPTPSESDSERACLTACRGWSTGCAQITFGALGCVRSEKMGMYFLKLMRCMGISDAAERRECLLVARDKLSELRDVLGEVRAARQTCRELSEDCRLDCDAAF